MEFQPQDPMEQEEESDPELAERAQTACVKMCVGMVLFWAALGFLFWNMKVFSKDVTEDGFDKVSSTTYLLAVVGFLAMSIGIYLMLSPCGDSVDAVTDMMPCLPGAIEEAIDGMADGVIGLISCCSGLCCCLFITAITMAYYNPMTSLAILGVMLVICILTGVITGFGKGEKEEVSEAEEMGFA